MAMHNKVKNSEGEFVCSVCGGRQIPGDKTADELTYDCCGRVLTKEEKAKIAGKELDYISGKWKQYVALNAYI